MEGQFIFIALTFFSHGSLLWEQKKADFSAFFIQINSYFTGTFFKVSTKNFQNFSTDAMFTLSTGECGCSIVGPNEIISQLG